MQKLLMAVFVCLTSFFSPAVKAQNGELFEIDIPFEFTVRGEILPAGKYKVGRFDPTKPNVLILKNTQNGNVRSVFVQRVESATPSSSSCVIFARRRDMLTLYQVWTIDDMSGSQVPLANETKRAGDKKLSFIKVGSSVADRAKK